MPSTLPNSNSGQLSDWLRPHLKWITVPSWLLSGLFHAILAAAIIIISQLPSCRGDIGGDEGESFRDVGIHIRSSDSANNEESESESDEEPSEVVYENPLTIPEPETDSAPPVALQLPKMETLLPRIGVGAIPVPVTNSANDLLQPSDNSNPRPTSLGSGAPVAGGTSFIGIEDVGRRFVYVIDRSFSMDNDGALQAAKTELLASLARLNETQQFQIIFYSGTFDVLKPRDGRFDMFWGTDAQRMQVSGRLRSIAAKGGTHHLPALNKALEGNPDVIYLLTDGAAETALTGYELNQIKKRNRSGTHIHCIEFGRTTRPALDGAGNFLRELAKQNQGQYVYRNVKRNR